MSITVERDGQKVVTHDELASSLARWLRLAHERVTWENIQFDGTDEVMGKREHWQCRPDVISIKRTLSRQRCAPWAFECKVSRSDFLSDINSRKWMNYTRFACRVFFAMPVGIALDTEVPKHCGYAKFNPADGRWQIVRYGSLIKDATLSDRHLMKLILGRWGTEPTTS